MHLKIPPLLLTVILAALMFAESRLMSIAQSSGRLDAN